MGRVVWQACDMSKGRKRKTPKDWATEHEDLEVKKKCADGESNDVLCCKYCSTEIDVVSTGRKPWDRVHEHLASKRHERLKQNYLKRVQEGKQLTLFETEIRAKSKEKEAEGAIHDLVRALSFSAIPITQLDTFLGLYLRKYCPALRSMPKSQQVANKYLVDVYNEHMSTIKSKIVGKKICFIIDESPDILGRPAVNTLIAFYDDDRFAKTVLLVDTCILKACNSTTLAFVLARVLDELGKEWTDVIGIASDSAVYMRKLYTDLKASHNSKLVQFNDVSHLIHVAIDTALHCPEFELL